MEISQFLSAIQSLEGETQGAKYRTLHSIATKLIEDEKEKVDFMRTGNSDRVNPALLPHLRILVGIKLKSNEAVIKALKSDDVTIIKLALGAKWFFHASNPLLEAENFIQYIVPQVSLRTRLELVKTLANCLTSEPKKADEFFDKFSEIYGTEQALPLITACSEDHIYDEVLKRKITLPSRMLTLLYRRYPKLVIRYLQLGNAKNKNNATDRKIHSVELSYYDTFLPILVRNHTREFAQLYECISDHYIKLGSTRAEFFLKNGLNIVIEKPKVYLKILPFKLVYNKLSTQQFEVMFHNLFDKSTDSYELRNIIKYLEYYPEDKKFELLRETYKTICGVDLMECKSSVNYDCLRDIMPANLKEDHTRKILEKLDSGSSDYWEQVQNLPPKDSIPLLKNQIANVSGSSRIDFLWKMVHSCRHYNSKDDLLEVLKYYNTRHKNEQATVLLDFLKIVIMEFKIMELDKSHWVILKDIIQRAFIKGDLFVSGSYFEPSGLFVPALKYFLKQCREDPTDEDSKTFLNTIMNIILEYYFEKNTQWDFVVESPELEKDCLDRFLKVIPEKYPETHAVWAKKKMKLTLTTYLIRRMNEVNRKVFKSSSTKRRKSKSGSVSESESNFRKFAVRDHSWLAKFVLDLLKSEKKKAACYKDKLEYRGFKKALRLHDPTLYRKLIDENPDLLYDVTTGDAPLILKREPNKILSQWKDYLDACRERLQKNDKATKNFVARTKWYQEIPIKFVEESLKEIEVNGSIAVLGILLEGKALEGIIEPYLPKDAKLDIEDAEAKKAYDIVASIPAAINSANPPVSLDFLTPLCTNDYLPVFNKCITNVIRRVPIESVFKFAEKLMEKSVSVKKLGIRLYVLVASNNERRQFFLQKLNAESNAGIREVIAGMIHETFIQSPSDDTWDLMKLFLDGLKASDKSSLSTFVNVKSVNKSYIADFIKLIMKKLDEFSEEELCKKDKLVHVSSLLTNIDEGTLKELPEELLMDILKNDLFECPNEFIFNIYLFSDEEKFQQRLQVILDIVQEVSKHLHIPDAKVPRCYPTRRKFGSFLREMMECLLNNDSRELSSRVINSFVTKSLVPKESSLYLTLNLYKIYFEETDPKKFGERCIDKVKELIKDYNSESIIDDFTQEMKKILRESNVYKDIKRPELLMTVIEGMVSKDLRLSAMIGVKMLGRFEIKEYDHRYDEFVKIWLSTKDIIIHYVVNDFLASIDKLYLL